MSRNILIYGNDPTLLLTRRLVLQHAGFNVTATSEFHQAVSLTITGQIDLLILCQSLGPHERQGVLETARGAKPTMKTFILDATVAPTEVLENERVVDNFFLAETLIDRVNQMLGVNAT
jgi:DNA-binding response OmpR family regulator